MEHKHKFTSDREIMVIRGDNYYIRRDSYCRECGISSPREILCNDIDTIEEFESHQAIYFDDEKPF